MKRKHPARPRQGAGTVNPVSAGPLALPHEHDQVPEQRKGAGHSHQPEVAQAARDLAAGQVDTDNYTRARAVTREALVPDKT